MLRTILRTLVAFSLASGLSSVLAGCSTAPDEDTSSLDNDTPSTIYLTTMTHMEESHQDDENEMMFSIHVEQIRSGLALASEYSEKLTIESEKPFARANEIWNHNMLQEILDSGHGVGTHCDIGGIFTEPVPQNVADFAAMFEENKALVDALVGAENNKGCSGGASTVDWVLASSQAGFEYIDGLVGGHYLSMPVENRPSDQWTDDYIVNVRFHSYAPYDLEDRIYPRLLADAQDFEHDDDGVIAVMAGGVASFVDNCMGDKPCTMTAENVDTLVTDIEDIEEFRDKLQFTKLTVYLSVGQLDEEENFRYFLERMEQLQDDGIVQWATQLEAYEAYQKHLDN